MKYFLLLLLCGIMLSSTSRAAFKEYDFEKSAFKKTSLSGDLNQLKKFFNSLKDSKTGKIRIAHYGDSIVWGDVITADLRENFQKKFGGSGAGFQPIASDDIKVKQTTRHTFSDNWDWASLFTRNQESLPLGIAGIVAKSNGSSWVKYEGTNFRSSSKSFKEARIFYSNAGSNCKINYSFNGSGKQSADLKSGNGVSETTVKAAGDAASLQIDFSGCSGANFYGVSLESGNGVYVDNFPMRGTSGVTLSDIPEGLLKDFNKMLNYKLIILNFGLNIASAEQTNYTWYRTKMTRVVKYLKDAFPEASILLVSVGDKGIKKGSRFVTDPSILKVLEEQKDIAKNAGVAFWNLYDAMGGENSMAEWVNNNMASKDYSHFTDRGGKKIADLLMDALMDEYNKQK